MDAAVDGPRLRDDVVHGEIPWLLRDFRQELHFPGDADPFALGKLREEPVIVTSASAKPRTAFSESQSRDQPDGFLYNLLNCNKLWFWLSDAVVTWRDLRVQVGHFDQFILASCGIKPRQQQFFVLGKPVTEELVKCGFLLEREKSDAAFCILLCQQLREPLLQCLVVLRNRLAQASANDIPQGILGQRWRHFT